MCAVGDGRNGKMPNRFIKKMNRNRLAKNGRYLCASCSPTAGTTILSRMKYNTPSIRFHSFPVGGSPDRILAASQSIAAATISPERTMKTWNLVNGERLMSQPIDSKISMWWESRTWVNGASCFFSTACASKSSIPSPLPARRPAPDRGQPHQQGRLRDQRGEVGEQHPQPVAEDRIPERGGQQEDRCSATERHPDPQRRPGEHPDHPAERVPGRQPPGHPERPERRRHRQPDGHRRGGRVDRPGGQPDRERQQEDQYPGQGQRRRLPPGHGPSPPGGRSDLGADPACVARTRCRNAAATPSRVSVTVAHGADPANQSISTPVTVNPTISRPRTANAIGFTGRRSGGIGTHCGERARARPAVQDEEYSRRGREN